MSATPARNWASMLKEKKTTVEALKAVVAVPTEAPTKHADPIPVASVAAELVAVPAEPAKKEAAAPVQAAEESVLSPASVDAPVEVAAPAVAYVALGPVSMKEALAKLVQTSTFRFAGAVVSPPSPVAAAPQSVVTPPAPVTPPVLATAAAAAPVVTSSSEIRGHPQWTVPQPVYNPPVNYFVPPHAGARPYGGELGSVPRYYNAERQFSAEEHYQAQPYHPTYHSAYGTYRGGYGGVAHNAYPNYYPGLGMPHAGSRLQAQQPYYPPRNYQLQQQ